LDVHPSQNKTTRLIENLPRYEPKRGKNGQRKLKKKSDQRGDRSTTIRTKKEKENWLEKNENRPEKKERKTAKEKKIGRKSRPREVEQKNEKACGGNDGREGDSGTD
jgi:hypothetical protein